MSTRFPTRFALCFSIGASLLLSACQQPQSVVRLAPTNTVVPTIQVVATVAPSATNTRLPDTPTAAPTAVPSDTATARPADTATAPATATTKPTVVPTNTAAPTVAPTAAHKATARPTLPRQPTATKAPVVAASQRQRSSSLRR